MRLLRRRIVSCGFLGLDMRKLLFLWAVFASAWGWWNHDAYHDLRNQMIAQEDQCGISDVAASKFRQVKSWFDGE